MSTPYKIQFKCVLTFELKIAEKRKTNIKNRVSIYIWGLLIYIHLKTVRCKLASYTH